MRSALQLLGGVAVAGVVAAGSSAFTAAGLTIGGSVTNFVGGQQTTVSVSGTQIDGITYGFSDGAKTRINAVHLHFADANSEGATVAVVLNGGSWTTAASLTCGNVSSAASNCTPNVGGGYYTGITDIDVTVA